MKKLMWVVFAMMSALSYVFADDALTPSKKIDDIDQEPVSIGNKPSTATPPKAKEDVVKENSSELRVTSEAPVPQEVDNESQAKALSQEAAVVQGQTALLKYVLLKKTHSKKTLAEAEYPYVEMQDKIRGYIKGAQVVRTEWLAKSCRVTLVLNKKYLKEILSKN